MFNEPNSQFRPRDYVLYDERWAANPDNVHHDQYQRAVNDILVRVLITLVILFVTSLDPVTAMVMDVVVTVVVIMTMIAIFIVTSVN